MRARSVCMLSLLPKTMASGGISPIDCTSELTEFIVVITLLADPNRASISDMCIPDAKLAPSFKGAGKISPSA
jgi:hypothetical protein